MSIAVERTERSLRMKAIAIDCIILPQNTIVDNVPANASETPSCLTNKVKKTYIKHLQGIKLGD